LYTPFGITEGGSGSTNLNAICRARRSISGNTSSLMRSPIADCSSAGKSGNRAMAISSAIMPSRPLAGSSLLMAPESPPSAAWSRLYSSSTRSNSGFERIG
jgi:hypothetical protein